VAVRRGLPNTEKAPFQSLEVRLETRASPFACDDRIIGSISGTTISQARNKFARVNCRLQFISITKPTSYVVAKLRGTATA
jgi:hypothetical protein